MHMRNCIMGAKPMADNKSPLARKEKIWQDLDFVPSDGLTDEQTVEKMNRD